MADYLCKVLRDGALEGEHAPALTIKDSINSPFGLHVFDYILSQLSSHILAGKSQSKGLVIVAFSRSPSFYVELLSNGGIDPLASDKWIRIMDCYSDPLGWKDKLKQSGIVSSCPSDSFMVTLCRDVKNLDKLLSGIIELSKGLVGHRKDRVSIAIDSVTEMLRHASLSSVAGLLSSLRSHEHVSSIVWLLHSDLHDARENAVLEYTSSIVGSVESLAQLKILRNAGSESFSFLDQNARRGRLHVRSKRRNGRIKLMSEEFHIGQAGITFAPVSSEDESVAQTLLPKVQFNLQLSEKEQMDRSKVVLPFEHQENDKAEQIYDGRRSVLDGKSEITPSTEKPLVNDESARGQILYVRDSDDELPDSDEDPDDDLDI
ncbi:hypothetical protein Ancab_034764 [Ancistrocladus abbreviatus]